MIRTSIYKFWKINKISNELIIAKRIDSSILIAYETKSITGRSIDDVKAKIDKHIKRWGW